MEYDRGTVTEDSGRGQAVPCGAGYLIIGDPDDQISYETKISLYQSISLKVKINAYSRQILYHRIYLHRYRTE